MSPLDTKKITQNDWLVIGGGILAFIALFLPWWGFNLTSTEAAEAHAEGIGTSVSGWSTGFEGWFGGLLLLAAAGYLFFLRTGSNAPKLPVGPGVAVLAASALGTLLIIIRWATIPRGAFGASYGAKYGMYVAIVVGVVEVVGALRLFRASGEALPWAATHPPASPAA